MPIRVVRKADRPGLSNAFQTGDDIDAISHQIAVGFLDDIAQMYADAKLDATIERKTCIALSHSILHLDRAPHRIDHAAEFDERSIACALDDAPVIHGNDGINQIAAECPKPRQRQVLVRTGQSRIAHHIGNQNGD